MEAAGPSSVLQTKQPFQRIDQTMWSALSRFVLQGFQRRMQQLIDDPLKRSLDLFAVLFVQMRQLVKQAIQLFFADAVPVVHQLGNDIAAGTPIELGHELGCFVLNQFTSLVDLANSSLAIFIARFLQTIDVVQKDIFQITNIRSEISRTRGSRLR